MRILLAEDDQVLADGLCRSLRGSGYAVDHVGNGSDADSALALHEYDLLILDLGQPLEDLQTGHSRQIRSSSGCAGSIWVPTISWPNPLP